MAARFTIKRKKDELAEAFKSMKDPIASAGSGAITEAAEIVKREARADIAAAGFSKRWQNALRAQVYPRRGRVSMNAAAMIWHKIQYAGIFEEGGDIAGKPRLWLPLSSTPKQIGRKRMTPALYVREIGPLFPLNRPGRAPLLAGAAAVSRRKNATGKISLSSLKRGAGGGVPTRLVPLFVGVDRVTIRDKFSIREITERAAARLGALYLKHLNPNG